MATVNLTRGNTLPNSSQKADFHNLIDLATGSVSNIVNADIDSAAAIADTKLATISTASKVSASAIAVINGLTEKVTLVGDDLFMIADSEASNATKKVKSSTLATTYAFTPTAANALAGSIVQVINASTATRATTSTVIPLDNTIPQNTEGADSGITCTITPTNASNKLMIIVHANATAAAGNTAIVALFQDSTADALHTAAEENAFATAGHPIDFVHYMTAGTTSATSFKIRYGADTGNAYLNGDASAALFGGTFISSITVLEVKV